MNQCEMISKLARACQITPIVSTKTNIDYTLDVEQICKISSILEKGDRVELIPCKDGIKIIQEIRKEVK